jgi:hypothetical protein
MIGQTLAHYRITAKLGEGGMGVVYRATDSRLGREVALKVLPASVAGDAERMGRFEREARTLASLNHPNIAAIYGIEAGALVMELVEGQDLSMAVPVTSAGGELKPGAPQSLFETGAYGLERLTRKFDELPDGRFVVIERTAEVVEKARMLHVISNWPALLEKKQ